MLNYQRVPDLGNIMGISRQFPLWYSTARACLACSQGFCELWSTSLVAPATDDCSSAHFVQDCPIIFHSDYCPLSIQSYSIQYCPIDSNRILIKLRMPCGHFEHFPNKLYFLLLFWCLCGRDMSLMWINHITKFTTLTKCQFWIVLDTSLYWPQLTILQ